MSTVSMERRSRRLLHVVRERLGTRTIQDSSDAVRGGNNLYLWQWAFLESRLGNASAVIRSASMPAWIEEFPLLGELTLDRNAVRLLDRRRFATRFFYDHDFDRTQNGIFSRALISSSDSFRKRLRCAQDEVDATTITVNVRRGDYYSVPAFTQRFGMDIRHHVTEALTIAEEAGRAANDVLVVSDDVEWCRRELGGVLGAFRTLEDRSSMFDDLAALAVSRTLVLANSTFSYWGSYLAEATLTGHLAIAPSHHEITSDGERIAPMFDPRWPTTSYREPAS